MSRTLASISDPPSPLFSDRNHDGVLSREDIVSFMAKLPIEQILKHSASHAAERLPSLVEEVCVGGVGMPGYRLLTLVVISHKQDDEDEANEARLDEEHRAAIEAEEKAAEAAVCRTWIVGCFC